MTASNLIWPANNDEFSALQDHVTNVKALIFFQFSTLIIKHNQAIGKLKQGGWNIPLPPSLVKTAKIFFGLADLKSSPLRYWIPSR